MSDVIDEVVGPLDGELENVEDLYNNLWRDKKEFKDFPFDKKTYERRIKSLQKIVRDDQNCAMRDEVLLSQDRVIHPKSTHNARGVPRWEGLVVDSLRLDMDAGLHNFLGPKELWLTRQEYQQYPLDVFRKHIYQEKRRRKKRHPRKKKKIPNIVYLSRLEREELEDEDNNANVSSSSSSSEDEEDD